MGLFVHLPDLTFGSLLRSQVPITDRILENQIAQFDPAVVTPSTMSFQLEVFLISDQPLHLIALIWQRSPLK